MDSQEQLPSTDELVRLLARERRRHVLRYLAGSEAERIPLEDVAASLAASDVGPGTERGWLIDLHHTHVPRLAEHGLVEYDPETRTVTYRSNPEVEALLSAFDTHME